MSVIGIQRGHDAGLCLMRGGKVEIAVEAERVHRIKHADGPGTIPEAARIAFRQTALSAKGVDAVVIADSFRDRIEHALAPLTADMHEPGLLAPLGHYGAIREISDIGIAGIPADTPVLAACHHACHAAGAIYMSGYDDALVYAYDGWGVCAASVAYLYRDGRLTRLEDSVDRILIGWRYDLLAQFLAEINERNTRKYDYSGKLMGLSAYGTPRPEAVRRLKSWLRRDYEDYKSSWSDSEKSWFPGLINEAGFTRDSSHARDPDFQTLLASLQLAMNQVVCEEVKSLAGQHQCRNVIVTGGCALNIVANDALGELPGVERLFVPPNANDAGLAMGAAVIGAAYGEDSPLHFPHISRRERRSPFKGPHLLGRPSKSRRFKTTRPPGRAALDRVVEALMSGGMAGFVQGRMEIGPRALGHRSLLADAAAPDMRETLNRRIKQREWWRPFAPVVRSVDAERYFEITRPCPYMLRTALIRAPWRDRLPAVAHVDHTARLQVLEDEAADPALWYVLSELERRRGIGVCLNTSLNLGGAPILNSHAEIHRFLDRTELQFVYVDGAIIERA